MANDLRDFQLRDLYERLAIPEDEFEQWMATQGLLHGSMDCLICYQPMFFRRVARPVDGSSQIFFIN